MKGLLLKDFYMAMKYCRSGVFSFLHLGQYIVPHSISHTAGERYPCQPDIL